jgi:hypothetical protein
VNQTTVTTSEIAMPSAYISALNGELEARRVGELDPPPGLHQRFIEWYANLPEISRQRPFAMSELEQALGTQGKYLSPILLGLGWRRKRRWSTQGQYFRYWEPPSVAPSALALSSS